MTISRDSLIRKICTASLQGSLGLFIGAGFSKEMLGDDASYNWKQLLEKCCEKLNVNLESKDWDQPLQTVGSKIEAIAKQQSQYEVDYSLLKLAASKIVAVFPEGMDKDKKDLWVEYFNKMKPAWITTTNYDHIIEYLLGGKALTLLPKNYFVYSSDVIPVYHLHGSFIDPVGIVITNEDYVHLLRPGDYRQNRLPFLLKENTVVMVGYELNDFNVITAVDWANNVYTNTTDGFDSSLIQIRYVENNPQTEPYEEREGLLVLETDSITTLFGEICEILVDMEEKYNNAGETASQLMATFTDLDNVKTTIDELSSQRCDFVRRLYSKLINLAQLGHKYLWDGFVSYCRHVMSAEDEHSLGPFLNFSACEHETFLLVEIMKIIGEEKDAYPVMQIPESFIVFLCGRLNHVAFYFDFSGRQIRGKAWNATNLWKDNLEKISQELIERMKHYCNSDDSSVRFAKHALNIRAL